MGRIDNRKTKGVNKQSSKEAQVRNEDKVSQVVMVMKIKSVQVLDRSKSRNHNDFPMELDVGVNK